MSRRTILADVPRRIDNVVLAVSPLDAFTGAVVRSGVMARIEGHFDRPIRNQSGHLVFINLPPQDDYVVTVDASPAGYFSPVTFVFVPPQPGDTDAEHRRHIVMLTRRPDFAFGDEATLIRGVVVRGTTAVIGALIQGTVDSPSSGPFETVSGEKGAFVLPLRIARSTQVPPETGPFKVALHFEEGGDTRDFTRGVQNNKSHSFAAPIDLTGTDDNFPPFFPP